MAIFNFNIRLKLFIIRNDKLLCKKIILYSTQTDKALVTKEADDDGVLAKILVPEGTTGVQVHTFQ